MKTLLKLEELAMFLVCLVILYGLTFNLWCLLLLAVAPDISMLGYLVNRKVGAYCYNFFHHKGIAILLIFFGIFYYMTVIVSDVDLGNPDYVSPANYFLLAGIIMFGHSSMDRFFGFGLKTEEGFKFTHLGKIGKNEEMTNE